MSVSFGRLFSFFGFLFDLVGFPSLPKRRREQFLTVHGAALTCMLGIIIAPTQLCLAQSPDKPSSQPRVDSNTDATLQKILEMTGKNVLEAYDADPDGFLTRDEMANMARTPTDPVFDTNGDSKISHGELIESVRNPFAPDDAKVLASRWLYGIQSSAPYVAWPDCLVSKRSSSVGQ